MKQSPDDAEVKTARFSPSNSTIIKTLAVVGALLLLLLPTVNAAASDNSALPPLILIVGIVAVLLIFQLLRGLRKSRLALSASAGELERSEAARRAAEDYKTVFRLANESLLIFEPETETILDASDKACETYGFAREEFIGKSLKELSRNVESGERQLANLLSGGNRHHFETVNFRADKTPINFLVNASVVEYRGRRAILSVNRDVTGRRKAEESLQKNLSLLTSTFEATADGIMVVDLNNTIVTYNRQFIEMWQIPDEIIGSRDNEKVRNFVLDQLINADEFAATTEKLIARPEMKNYDILSFKDGKIYERYSQPQMMDGKIVGRVLSFRDITQRRHAEAELRRSENKFRMLVESTSEGILQVDGEDRTQFVNNRLCEMVGYSREEMLGADWCQLLLDEEGCNLVKKVNERRRRGISDRYEISLKKKSGETLWVIIGGAPVTDAEGVVTGSMGIFTDITDRKRAEEQLLHDAFHDGLTGLANRALFMDHLQMAVERGRSPHSNLYAVLFLDFDRFKVVNDSLGHAEGDRLLQQIARRLEACTRTGDLTARFGGDEFVILLNELVEEEDALRVAERIREDMKTPFDLSGHEVFTSASIGIALSASGRARAEDMLRDADLAMYRAKSKGKARHQLFDPTMHEQASAKLKLENEMRRAVEQQEFCLYYQPIVDLRTNNIVGFESLARWRHPTRGITPPAEFIPIAEETGLIIPLGEWIVRESCRQLREWQTENPLDSNLTVSVNLSCRQFAQPDLAGQIGAILRETAIKPENLRLEVTESYLMEDSEQAITIMNRLRSLGVKISIDDFGTGYSSLSYLHRLPVNYLKIDRSFVSQMQTSAENAEIVRTIIMLAKNLNIEVIAEGVETSGQAEHLKNLDCRFAQGYFFSKPVAAERIRQLIDDFAARAATADMPDASDLNLELINNVEH